MKYKTAKRTHMTKGALTAVALLAASSLFAGNSEDARRSAQGSQDAAKTAMTARSIEGMDFKLKSGEEAGVINELVFSTEEKEIVGLSVGTGFLGLGGSEHYIGFDDISISNHDRFNLTTSLAAEELEKYPRLDEESLQTERDPETEVRSGEFAMMDLVGRRVEGTSGESHGEVHDWIVDMETGDVPYVIVRQAPPFASPTGQGFDYYAVSADRIVGVSEGGLVLSVSDEAFASAGYIDENSLLRDADESGVHSFRYDAGRKQASL
ncbi:PRC-barrel domain-containing protein [Pelagicoccus sp. SDUM812005]|nr:PRC-barrel domain-containing protein [Pelagicoccus sp. SDUM812005]